MMTVAQVSSRGNVAPHVVRYYARIGLLHPRRHPDNGYQLFSETDVKHLQFIRQAQSLGYTLEEIRHILSLAAEGRSPCGEVRQTLERRIKENRAHLAELQQLQQRMEAALAEWQDLPDGAPGDPAICHLIEGSTDSDG